MPKIKKVNNKPTKMNMLDLKYTFVALEIYVAETYDSITLANVNVFVNSTECV